VLNVAIPTLANDLHASTSQLQWFSTAYTLVLAAALLPAGCWATASAQADCCSGHWCCSAPPRPHVPTPDPPAP